MYLENWENQSIIDCKNIGVDMIELVVFIFNKINTILKDYSYEEDNITLNRAIQQELNFYNKVILGLVGLLNPNKENVILFDLDETIIQNVDWWDKVRPIFFKLVKDLRLKFSGIKIWILTGRGENNIKEQIKNWSLSHIKDLFDTDYIFSSRDSEEYCIHDESFPQSNLPGHVQKVNAIFDLKNIYPNTKFILIDDQADESFEKLQLWIVIWKKEFFVYWELIWVSK